MNTDPPIQRRLRDFENSEYAPGRGALLRTLWYFVSLLLLESGWLPVSRFKAPLLRWFGATIGKGVVIKPHVRIKYPWRLTVGDDCWIGQQVWIDNLDDVVIEHDVCISQGAYLCTGSHNHRSPTFELKIAPIHIRHGAWIAARAILLGGADIPAGQVVPAGTVVGKSKPS